MELRRNAHLLLLLGLHCALLGHEDSVDVGKDAARGDRDLAEQLVKLLVIAHGELHVARDDARLLVVASGIACKLEDLGGQVLEHGREVHGCTGTDTRRDTRVLNEAGHTANGELKSRLCASRYGLGTARLLSTTSCDDIGKDIKLESLSSRYTIK